MMKNTNNFLSKLNLFTAVFNATINPDGHNIRMMSECIQEQSASNTSEKMAQVV